MMLYVGVSNPYNLITNQNHRMAGLLAAKLLLLHHDPRDQPGKHLEEQGHLILDMINAAREETP